MSKQTLILIIILSLSTVGLLILALNKSLYKPTQIIQPPTPSIKPVLPETSLLFGSLDIASTSGKPKTYSLPIIINTGTNKVTAVQLELSFDPNILTNVNITPSTFFKNPNVVINKINNDIGKISYAIASESARQGEDALATLTFNANVIFDNISNAPVASDSAAGNFSAITFLSRTFVTAQGLESSALKSTNSAELKFGN